MSMFLRLEVSTCFILSKNSRSEEGYMEIEIPYDHELFWANERALDHYKNAQNALHEIFNKREIFQ